MTHKEFNFQKENIWATGEKRNNVKIFNKEENGGTTTSAFNDVISFLTKTNSIHNKEIDKKEKLSKILNKVSEKQQERNEKISNILNNKIEKYDFFSRNTFLKSEKNLKKEKVLNLIEEIINLLNGRSSLLRENTIILLNKIKNNIEFENIEVRYNELNELKKSIVKEKKEDIVDLSSCINAFKNI